LQVNSRISPEDLALLRKAAEKLWPGISITNSTLLLMLARMKAHDVVKSTSSTAAIDSLQLDRTM